MEQDPAANGTGFELSTVQTLITLYQKIIEYYSAIDDKLYLDIKDRMQALLNRPEIEVLLAEAREQTASQSQLMTAAETEPHEESKEAIHTDFAIDEEVQDEKTRVKAAAYNEVMEPDEEEKKTEEVKD